MVQSRLKLKFGNIACLYVEVVGGTQGVGAAIFPGTGLDERSLTAKKYSSYIAAASMDKTAQIHINGFD